MDQINNNPLQKYFRVPGLSIRLPSQGLYQPVSNITFNALDEVPVYPMRSQDELLMKNPDALLSGVAVEELIKSCVPSVLDPRALPTPDVDALLLAIRSATYGNMMNIESECPNCNYLNGYEVDISTVLNSISPLAEEYSVRLSDELIVHMCPSNLTNSTRASNAVFQETRRMSLVEESDASNEEKQLAINTTFKNLTDMNMQVLIACVEKIVTPDGSVTNKQHIAEFINNINIEWSNKLEDMLKTANASGIDKSHHVQCVKCDHEWDTLVEFDPTTFFGPSS